MDEMRLRKEIVVPHAHREVWQGVLTLLEMLQVQGHQTEGANRGGWAMCSDTMENCIQSVLVWLALCPALAKQTAR